MQDVDSTVASDNGNVEVTGIGGGTDTGNAGIAVANGGQIMTVDGTITVKGIGSEKGSSINAGVVMNVDSTITSGNGDINITGIGGGTGIGYLNYGIAVGGQISSNSDSIKLVGNGGVGSTSHGLSLENNGTVNGPVVEAIGKTSGDDSLSYGIVQATGGQFISPKLTITGTTYFPNNENTITDITGNIEVKQGAFVVKIDKDAKNTRLTSSESIILSKASLIIDDNDYMSSDGARYIIAKAGRTIIPFDRYKDVSLVMGTSGQKYIIDYSTNEILLIRESDFESEPSTCGCGLDAVNIKIEIDTDLNINGKIGGNICLPDQLLE